MIDAILDRAGQKGTGKWTVVAAAELGVPIPTIAAAVDARLLSAAKDTRVRAEQAHHPLRGTLEGVTTADLADALYAAKIASYTQGFALLAAASRTHGYGTNLSEVARIWTAGCIIRATFLDRVRAAFSPEPVDRLQVESASRGDVDSARSAGGVEPPELLALTPEFVDDLARRLPAWRRVVAAASRAGLAAPGMAVSLAWYDTLTTARGSAAVIQAQRDYFGSHTYERHDNPGVPVHTEWTRFGGRQPGE